MEYIWRIHIFNIYCELKGITYLLKKVVGAHKIRSENFIIFKI